MMAALLACGAQPVRQLLDVQWVATPHSAATAALDWANVGPHDLFVELGCGDGRVALEAARRGARAICVERDPVLAAEARELVGNSSDAVARRVEVLTADMFEADLTSATVVFLFLLPELNARLRTALSDAPLLRAVVSHGFEIYGWKCGERMRVDDELFLKWEAPFAEQAQHSSLLPASIVEHAQDCGVEEEVMRSRSSTE